MLHLEVGELGRQEREKRHFPYLHNVKGVPPKYKPHGRIYIPHGSGSQPDYVPHNQGIDPKYSECDRGLDWSSRLRWLPDQTSPPAENVFAQQITSLRHFPQKWHNSKSEWTAYPEGYHIGKKCTFPQHTASLQTENEITHTMLYGKGRRVPFVAQRNGLSAARLGDKAYQAPEYSPSFHQYGSTRPVVQFGGSIQQRHRPQTFVPLQPLSTEHHLNFLTKEKRRIRREEMDTVRCLDKWRPATPLAQTLPSKDN